MDTHISHLAHLDERDDSSATDLPNKDGSTAREGTGTHLPPQPPVDHARRVILPGEGPSSEPADLTAAASDGGSAEPALPPAAARKAPLLSVAAFVVAAAIGTGVYLTAAHHHQAVVGPEVLDHPTRDTSPAPATRVVTPTKTQEDKAHTAVSGGHADMKSLMALQTSAPQNLPQPVAPPLATHAAPSQIVSPKPSVVLPVEITDPTQALSRADVRPMSRQQQADVLQMVTRLGAMVRDLRLENAVRERQLEAFSKATSDKLSDFDQRLSLEEAHASVDGAASAGAAPTSEPPTDAKAPSRPSSSPASVASSPAAVAKPAIPLRNLSVFRIQAASPGLAVLQVTSPGLNEPGILQVAVGDDIPGLGSILSIAQRGVGWEVRTDRGVIR